MDAFQRLQRIVDGDNGWRAFDGRLHPVAEGAGQLAAAAFFRLVDACVIDENSAHDAGGDVEKMRAVAIVGLRVANEADIRLMHESRGLQGMAGPLAAELATGELTELTVYLRHQAVEGASVACRKFLQQQGDGLCVHSEATVL